MQRPPRRRELCGSQAPLPDTPNASSPLPRANPLWQTPLQGELLADRIGHAGVQRLSHPGLQVRLPAQGTWVPLRNDKGYFLRSLENAIYVGFPKRSVKSSTKRFLR